MRFVFVFLVGFFVLGCDSGKFTETPINQFEGEWKVVKSGLLQHVEIEISSKNDNYSGKITRLNDNKMVQLFASEEDVVISNISRKSNFLFEVTEKKVAGELFSSYGLSTSDKIEVTFQGKDSVMIGEDVYLVRL